MSKERIISHWDLRVYQRAADLRQKIYRLTRSFPAEERYEATLQIRRSSRSVCAAIAEAWRKRRYKAHWISKISDAEQEAAETQMWLETVGECGYIEPEVAEELIKEYDVVLGQLTLMAIHPEKWIIPES